MDWEDALKELGGRAFEVWEGETEEVMDEWTDEQKDYARRVSVRAAEFGVKHIMGSKDGTLKDDIDSQVANLTVALGIDQRRIVEGAFWPSVLRAIEDGVKLFAKLAK